MERCPDDERWDDERYVDDEASETVECWECGGLGAFRGDPEPTTCTLCDGRGELREGHPALEGTIELPELARESLERMAARTEPVFKLESVPGWDHERVEGDDVAHPCHRWVASDGWGQVCLFDDNDVLLDGADFPSAKWIRQLITVLAMVRQELERREQADDV